MWVQSSATVPRCQFSESNTCLSNSLRGLFGDFHGTPLDNSSTESNPLPPLEALRDNQKRSVKTLRHSLKANYRVGGRLRSYSTGLICTKLGVPPQQQNKAKKVDRKTVEKSKGLKPRFNSQKGQGKPILQCVVCRLKGGERYQRVGTLLR